MKYKVNGSVQLKTVPCYSLKMDAPICVNLSLGEFSGSILKDKIERRGTHYDIIIAHPYLGLLLSNSCCFNEVKPKVKYVCSRCGTDDVLNDSYSQWDVNTQSFVHVSNHDNWVCEGECGGECSVDEIEV